MRSLMTRLAIPLALWTALACGEPPVAPARQVCVKTLTGDVDVPVEQAADILLVVDNSGSMAEEQGNLAANFLNVDPAECPLQDLANIPEEFKNPKRAAYSTDPATGVEGPLAKCGFVQIVAAFENDFRVGVITTDVGLCDNRLPPPGDTRGFHPQRGCLQPDASDLKVIARADLADGDVANDDLAGRFAATLSGISTLGSPFERGLDAMSTFLDPSSDRNPDCADDLTKFRRPEASLVVIFLTDEEDCSHGLGDGVLEAFGNENDEEVCGAFEEHFLGPPRSDECYDREDALSPVDLYLPVLLAQDPRAKVAVIAGALDDAEGNAGPAGCVVGGDGAPAGGCFESGGLSNFNGPDEVCGTGVAVEAARGGQPCCVADAGDRYFQFAELVGNDATDSICNQSFRQTMLQIAAFIAAVDVVELAEPPTSGGVLVEVTSAETNEVLILEELEPGANCALETGFLLEGTTIVLCGEGRPGPGDGVAIRARGGELETCTGPRLEISGGGANCGASDSAPASWSALVGLLLALGARRRR